MEVNLKAYIEAGYTVDIAMPGANELVVTATFDSSIISFDSDKFTFDQTGG